MKTVRNEICFKTIEMFFFNISCQNIKKKINCQTSSKVPPAKHVQNDNTVQNIKVFKGSNSQKFKWFILVRIVKKNGLQVTK